VRGAPKTTGRDPRFPPPEGGGQPHPVRREGFTFTLFAADPLWFVVDPLPIPPPCRGREERAARSCPPPRVKAPGILMFDSLSERLGNILDRLTGRGALSQADV